jgi:hypothetical protein
MFRKIMAAAGTLVVLGGLSLAATGVANAATPSCGSSCTNVYFQSPGHHYVTYSGKGRTVSNNPIELFGASNSRPGEDFIPIDVGTVVPEYCTSTGQSASGAFTNNQCDLLVADGYSSDQTWELEYSAYGNASGKCLGDWNNDGPITTTMMVRLEPCGENADTIQILAKHIGGVTAAGSGVFVVDGASDNYSNPFVETSQGEQVNSTKLYWEQIRNDDGTGTDTQSAGTIFGTLP